LTWEVPRDCLGLSAALIQTVFTNSERLALAGLLRGLTRETYALDLAGDIK
jgi:hypothetical protein